MGGEREPFRAPWVAEGPEERVVGPATKPDVPVQLDNLPGVVNVGTLKVGEMKQAEVARPMLLSGDGALVTTLRRAAPNIDRPSAFRDELGLDPEPTLDDAFELLSTPTTRLASYGTKEHAVAVRFQPRRAGTVATLLTVKAIGSDGSLDTKEVRIEGAGRSEPTPAAPPKIVDSVQRPDPLRAIEGADKAEPTGVEMAHDFRLAQDIAAIQARRLANKQTAGVELAAAEIRAYSRKPPPLEAIDQLIELALVMGVAGVAGVVSRYVAKHMAATLARPVTAPIGTAPIDTGHAPAPRVDRPAPSSDHLATFVGDSLKDGMKNGAKIAARASKTGSATPATSGGSLSPNRQIDFITRYHNMIIELQTQYETAIARLGTSLEASSHATALMNLAGEGMNHAGGTALLDQARVMELQWVAEVARHSLGSEDVAVQDGGSERTTKLDQARIYGPPRIYTEQGVPKHDGVLDIHVELPSGNTPVEGSTFEVRGAAITGVSQEVAERLKQTKLASAGIPLRLVVKGHPALITRDEIGRVRVNGYLPNKNGNHWTEAHMHKAATILVDKVLAQTLDGWGAKIETDDATGLEAPK